MFKNLKKTMSRVGLLSLFVAIIFGLSFSPKVLYTQSVSASGLYNWTPRTSAGSREWTSIVSSSDGTKLAAVVFNGYAYASTDSGATWTERTSAGFRGWRKIASSSDGTKLVATAGSNDYIYTSIDGGATWTERTSAGLHDWRGIASSSDGTKLVVVSINGHIYTSVDSGATWTQRTSPETAGWTDIASSSDGTKLAATNSYGYVYTSDDGGATWTARTQAGSRVWQHIDSSSDGTKLVAVPADAVYIYTSADGGVTWKERTSAGRRSWNDVASSSDGTKLVAVATYGYIYTSTDSGTTWTEETSSGIRWWNIISSSSDGTKLVTAVSNSYIYTNSPLVCGNGTIDSGEACDGTNLNNQTCQTKGFSGGTLQCATDCHSFNSVNCTVSNCAKVNPQNTSDLYLYINGQYRKFANEALFISYGYVFNEVLAQNIINNTPTPLGSNITTVEDGVRTACPGSSTNTCTDTDGGQTWETKGSTSNTDGYSYNDTCLKIINNVYTSVYECSGTDCQLSEGYCNGSTVTNIAHTCANGCENGACKQSTIGTPTCTDSDGQNPNLKGYVSGKYSNGESFTTYDECTSDNTKVNERFCYNTISNPSTPVSSTMVFDCANGCADGACKQSTTTTCGDGIKNGTEQCDKTDLSGATCASMGYTGGTLACQTNCNFTFANCGKDNVVADCASPLTNYNYLSGFDSGDTLSSLLANNDDVKLNKLIDQTVIKFGNHEFALPNLYQKLIGEAGCTWMEHWDTKAGYIYSYIENDKVSDGPDNSMNDVVAGKAKMLKALKDGKCCGKAGSGQQDTDENHLTPATSIKNEDNTLTLRLNRLISDLEQKVIDLETRLTTTINKALTNRLKGYLIIQPEANGEVWYTSPDTGERFFMADREATYGILSGMGNGIKASDLAKVPIGYDPNIYPTTGDGALVDTDQDGLTDILEQAIGTDPNNPDTDGDGFNDFAEVMGGYNPNGPGKMPIDMIFTKKLKGIYLDVENSNARGAAWYINPKDFKRYYVSPETAYNVMKSLSLGVSNNNLRQIPVGEFGELSQ